MSNVLLHGYSTDGSIIALRCDDTGLLKSNSSDTAVKTAVDEVKAAIQSKTLSKTTSSIDISGQSVVVSNVATEATLTTTNTKLDTIATGNSIIGTNIEQLNDKIILEGNYLQTNIKNFPSVSTVHVNNTDSLNVNVTNLPSNQTVNIDSVNPTALMNSVLYGQLPGDSLRNITCSNDGFLNCNITNSSMPISGSVSISNFPSSQVISGTVSLNTSSTHLLTNLYDYQGNGLTSTNHTAFKYGLDSASTLYTSDMTTRYALTSTSDGASKRGLDCNISSSVSLTTADATVHTDLTSATNGLPAINTTLKNTSSGLPAIVTAITDLQNTLYQGATTNTNGVNGLNVYPIMPKVKSFAISGVNNIQTADILMAGSGSNIGVNSYAWGLANANKTYYLYIPTGAPQRNISYTYINASGAEVTATASGVVNSYVLLQSSIVCINSFTVTGNVSIGSTDAIYITLANSGGAANSVCSLNGVRYNSNNAIFTVPSNAIATITSVDSILSTSNEYYYMNVWDAAGNRSIPWVAYQYITGVNNMRTTGGGDYGCLGRILTAGETVAFSTGGTTSTSKNVYGSIKVYYI